MTEPNLTALMAACDEADRKTAQAKALSQRRISSGLAAKTLRRYRSAHPDRVREWGRKRSACKINRLPRGTVRRIGELQKWRCAICRVSVREHYHVDHIMPLKLGGEHIPRNIQLLCPSCNVRKNAKDPITYMQSVGRLL